MEKRIRKKCLILLIRRNLSRNLKKQFMLKIRLNRSILMDYRLALLTGIDIPVPEC
jgi:hypothetical protein